jgi:PAS domain S-box-containing protein
MSKELDRIFGIKLPESGSVETSLNLIHPDDRELMNKSIGDSLYKNKPLNLNYRIIRPDGTERMFHSVGEVYFDVTGKAVRMLGTIQDITERNQAEEQIKASLKEKEVLLKEIHHRVKNNMQIISSLLNLQSGYIRDNKEALEMFQETQNRIRSMALIHEKLYQSKDLSRVNFAEYIQSLATQLFHSFAANSHVITLKVDVDDVFLAIDRAIPCGLIINELVSNSLKHAFPAGKEGEIRIGFHSDDNEFTLIVSDTGVGFPKDLDFRNTESLGLELVVTLTDQVGGTIELHSNAGTEWKIIFPA